MRRRQASSPRRSSSPARSGAAIVHDFAYGDLVFDGRRPESFLAEAGAREVGVEMFSLSKSYGMAGWRLGFVVGNAEIVARLNLLQEHDRSGVFVPLQRAAVAALTGPQETVEERRALYERRRDRALAAIPGARCEGTFFVWFRLPEGLTFERLLDEHRVAVAPGEGFGGRAAASRASRSRPGTTPSTRASRGFGRRSRGSRVPPVFEDLLRQWDGEHASSATTRSRGRGSSSASTRRSSARPWAARG